MDNERIQMIESSCDKIRKRLGLRNNPKIDFRIRKFIRHGNGKYILEKSEGGIIEPPETLLDQNTFSRPIGAFEEEYVQLAHDTKKKGPKTIILIEVITTINDLKIFAGYNLLLMDRLKNGERYCAIVSVHVREIFRACGLMTLLKDLEIEEAGNHCSDYIQTFHFKNNPYFNGAIIPSLKKGFILFHGSSAGGEKYEGKGYVHLRYYFQKQRVKDVSARFTDGTEYKSPGQNKLIIEYLKKVEQLPGKTIQKIEPYESL